MPLPSDGESVFKYPPDDPVNPNVKIQQLSLGTDSKGNITPIGDLYQTIIKTPRIQFKFNIQNSLSTSIMTDYREISSSVVNRYGYTFNFHLEPLSYLK